MATSHYFRVRWLLEVLAIQLSGRDYKGVYMEESILLTIKDMLGIEETYDGFDGEISVVINSAIMSLHQIGVGPEDGFSITGETETWADLFDEVNNIEAVKSYIHLKTRLEWDPPATSFLLEAINRQIQELEWRLSVQVS